MPYFRVTLQRTVSRVLSVRQAVTVVIEASDMATANTAVLGAASNGQFADCWDDSPNDADFIQAVPDVESTPPAVAALTPAKVSQTTV
jgi:hypothetical protein